MSQNGRPKIKQVTVSQWSHPAHAHLLMSRGEYLAMTKILLREYHYKQEARKWHRRLGAWLKGFFAWSGPTSSLAPSVAQPEAPSSPASSTSGDSSGSTTSPAA